ncbi:MAG: hypothetical protein LBT69_01230 [Lactobacillales bacterium]|jgi:O-antigen/teichoic acid export membrane protein|nr:hypothetical protein [Lactobacillales bacterium]
MVKLHNLQLQKDYFWNTLGTAAYSFIPVVFMIFVTRINGIFVSGIFTFSFNTSMIFAAVAIFGGRSYQITDVDEEFKSRDYVVSRIITCFLALFASSMICCFLDRKTLYISVITMIFVLYQISVAISDVFYGILQKSNKLYIAGFSLTLKTIAGSIVFMILDIMTKNILLSSLAFVFINIIFTIFYEIEQIMRLDSIELFEKKIKDYVNTTYSIIKKTWPLAFFGILNGVFLNVNRYYIQFFHPKSQGYYGVLFITTSFLNLLFSTILAPKIVRLTTDFKRKKIAKLKKDVCFISRISIALGIMISIVTYFLGIPVLSMIYNLNLNSFRVQLAVIVFVSIFYALSNILFTVFTIIRKLKSQLFLLISGIFIQLVLGPLFIKPFGINGAVIVYAIGNIFLFILTRIFYSLFFKSYEYET